MYRLALVSVDYFLLNFTAASGYINKFTIANLYYAMKKRWKHGRQIFERIKVLYSRKMVG